IDITNRKPRSISTTVCLTIPPSKQREAPRVRLDSPEAIAASWSARGRSRRSDSAIGRPSAETTIAWATPGVLLAKFVTSQLRLRASALSSGITPPLRSGSVLRPLADVGAAGDVAAALEPGAVAGQHAADLFGATSGGWGRLGLLAGGLLASDDTRGEVGPRHPPWQAGLGQPGARRGGARLVLRPGRHGRLPGRDRLDRSGCGRWLGLVGRL